MKISMDTYLEFITTFWSLRKPEFRGLRLGQAFCNKFSIQDSSLFYEEDAHVAAATIVDKYVHI